MSNKNSVPELYKALNCIVPSLYKEEEGQLIVRRIPSSWEINPTNSFEEMDAVIILEVY